MFDTLNERLAKVKNQLHKRRKWTNQLADYETELQEKQQAASNLKSKIEAARGDIEKLEEISFAHLLAILTGSTDERIQEKRDEIATTRLKYDESQRALAHIESSIKEIKNKMDALPDIDYEYQCIIEEKERLMEDANSPMTRRYNDLSENAAAIQSFLTEAKEAVLAGEKVGASLQEAIEKLQKAKGWGGLDMFGGGAFVTYVKHNHIDDAKESIHDAQTKMRMFHKELLDVNQDADLDIDIPGLLTFADFFFDGIFIDYIVQGKIEEAYEKAKEQQNEIDKVILQLNFRYDRKEKELNHLEEKKKQLLEGFGK